MASIKSLGVTLLLVYLVTISETKSTHRSSSKHSHKASSKFSLADLNPLSMIENVINPTTKAPSSTMLAITKASSMAIKIVEAATGTIRDMILRAKAIQNMTRTVGQETIDKVISTAESFGQERGGEFGCVVKVLGGAGGMGMQLGLDAIDCPGSKINDLEDMLDTVNTAGETLLTMGPKAALELDDCERKGGPLELLCDGEIALNLGERAAAIGVDVTTVVADAVDLLATIEPSLAFCAGEKVATMAGTAAALVTKFGYCTGGAVEELMGMSRKELKSHSKVALGVKKSG